MRRTKKNTSSFSSELFPLRPLTRETNDWDGKGNTERRNDKRKKKHLSHTGLFSTCFIARDLHTKVLKNTKQENLCKKSIFPKDIDKLNLLTF